MRRSQWYQIGKTIPRRSGVGPRQNIIGAIAFWREKNSAGQYELKHKVIQECLKVWDGRTTDASKRRHAAKKVKTEEPWDYHGNVTAEVRRQPLRREQRAESKAQPDLNPRMLLLQVFEAWLDELQEWSAGMEKTVWKDMGRPYLFLDGARSHKRLLDKAPTKSDTMVNIREWLGKHVTEAARLGIVPADWAEQEPDGKKQKKDDLVEILNKLKAVAPKTYAARLQLSKKTYGEREIQMVFTPPYHPELQPYVPSSQPPAPSWSLTRPLLCHRIERVWCCVKNAIAEMPCHTMTELDARLRLGFNTLVTAKVLASTHRQSNKHEDEYWAADGHVVPAGAAAAPLEPDAEEEADEANDTQNMDGPRQ